MPYGVRSMMIGRASVCTFGRRIIVWSFTPSRIGIMTSSLSYSRKESRGAAAGVGAGTVAWPESAVMAQKNNATKESERYDTRRPRWSDGLRYTTVVYRVDVELPTA